MMRNLILGGVATLVAAIAIGVYASLLPLIAGLMVASVVAVVLLSAPHKITWAIIALAFLACFPLPVAFPQSFTAGGGTIYVADLLTLLVLALVLSVPSAPRMKMLLVGALVVLATYAAIGLINHGDPSAVVRDLRGPVEVLALCAGLLVVLNERDPAVIRILVSALAVMVIGTAAVLVFETATRSGFFDLRSQDAVLYLGRQVASYSATRLTPPNDVLCAISGSAALMLWMQGRVKARQLWWFWPFVISGLAVGLANFSRNNLIAILAVVLAGTFLGGSFLRVVSRIVPLVLSALAILGSFVTFLVIYSPTARALLTSMTMAFNGRVLGGLDPKTLSVDSSALWRVRESNAALASISSTNGLGTGFGKAYRTILPGEPFTDGSGVFYVHSSYLWLPVKIGVPLSVLLFVLLAIVVIRPVRHVLRLKVSNLQVLSSWVVLALLPVFVVSPLPFSRNGAIAVGAALALAITARSSAYLSASPGSSIVSKEVGDTVAQGATRSSPNGGAQFRGRAALPRPLRR